MDKGKTKSHSMRAIIEWLRHHKNRGATLLMVKDNTGILSYFLWKDNNYPKRSMKVCGFFVKAT